MIAWPQLYRAEGAALGIRWPRGLLLHGPPGCGKTAAVHAVAAEVGAALHLVTAASLFGAYTGRLAFPLGGGLNGGTGLARACLLVAALLRPVVAGEGGLVGLCCVAAAR